LKLDEEVDKLEKFLDEPETEEETGEKTEKKKPNNLFAANFAAFKNKLK